MNLEGRSNSSELSEDDSNCHENLNFKLLRSRLENDDERLEKLAEKIKPLVKIDIQKKKIVFCDSEAEIEKVLLPNILMTENILLYPLNENAEIRPVKEQFMRLTDYTCYFPSDDENTYNLTVKTVLQQAPRSAILRLANCFEVRFLSNVPADNYDKIHKCHKAEVILYAPDFTMQNLLFRTKNKLSEKENKHSSRSEARERLEKKPLPCKRVPQR